ncbi:MAG: hypothetical protein V2I97_10540 [Desulfococcaceae bacterium]|nr:hypothetical protein [Desulfococcaceae bacterium]
MSGEDRSTHISGAAKADLINAGNHNFIQYQMGQNGKFQRVIPLEYYRVNRREQCGAIAELVRNNKKNPVVFILHGNTEECHDKFQECLRRTRWNKGIFKEEPKYILIEFDDIQYSRMISVLANEGGMEEKHFTPAEFNRKTRDISVLVFLSLPAFLISGPDKQQEIIGRFMDFWQAWPPRSRDDAPLAVCIALLYDRKDYSKQGFFQKIFRRFSGKPDGEFSERDLQRNLEQDYPNEILPILCPVEKTDAQLWGMEKDIRELCRKCRNIDVQSEIRDIYKKYGNDRIPMSEWAKAFEKRFPVYQMITPEQDYAAGRSG